MTPFSGLASFLCKCCLGGDSDFLTQNLFGLDGLAEETRALAFLVDRHDLGHILCVRHQSGQSDGRILSTDLSKGHPCGPAALLELDNIARYGQTTVRLWHLPGQHSALFSNLSDLEWSNWGRWLV